MGRLGIYKNVALRPFSATQMLWNHRRTLAFLWRRGHYKNFYNHILTTYLIRGEDCGKGVLDPIWKLTGRAPFLWDLEVEVTTACYLRCTHCEHTYWEDKSYLNQHLSLATFRKLVDVIPNLRWINLTGEGSSFLNPDFTKILYYAKSKGLYVDFSHDFAKLSEEHMWDLVTLGVDRVYWSFDGVRRSTYEKIRVGADFIKVIANVQKLIDLKKRLGSPLPEICFRFAFFKDNVSEVAEIPEFLASLVSKVKDYGDEPSINIVALLEFDETRGWESELDPGVIKVVDKQAKKLGFKVYWSHVTHIEGEKPPLDYCTFWSEPYVMITGHVVPCCAVLMSNKRDELERLSFGNINEVSIKDIWNSSYYREFRKMVVSPKARVPRICVGCRVFNTEERRGRFGMG